MMQTQGYATLAAALLSGLALLLYANTIHHDFALDDSIVIKENRFTQQGLAGIPSIVSRDSFEGWRPGGSSSAGGRYRPLSLVTFAVEVEFFGLNPRPMHTTNVILYALTAILLFTVLRHLLGPEQTTLAFLTSILFVAHPLHTEVVANIKSRDEILCLFFLLASILTAMRSVARPGGGIFASAACFLLALLAKEMAVFGILIIPLTLWFFRNMTPRRLAALCGGLASALLVYVILRAAVIGFPGDQAASDMISNPFAGATPLERYATIFLILGKYLSLLVVPFPLIWDYSYRHIEVVPWTHPQAIISLVLHILLVGYAVFRLRHRDLVAYGILFYLAGLLAVSNLIIPIGGTMAERFMFIPSLGFCLVVAHLANRLVNAALPAARTRSIALTVLFGALVFVYGARTMIRNADWKDNLTLFRADIGHIPNSVRARNALGESLMDAFRIARNATQRNALSAQAVDEFNTALALHRDARTLALLANAYRETGRLVAAADHYEQCLTLDPHHFHATAALAAIRFMMKDYVGAGQLYSHARHLEPGDTDLALGHAAALEKMGRLDEAAHEYRNYLSNRPDDVANWINLALLLQRMQKTEKAIEAADRAKSIGVEDLEDLNRLGSLYVSAGHHENAAQIYHRATRMDPGSLPAHNNLASLYAVSNRYGMAAHHFQMALKADPESLVTKQNLSKMLVEWGRDLFNEKRYTNALVKIRQAVLMNPENVEAMMLLGTCHSQLRRYDTAIEAFNYALRLDPNNRDIYHRLSNVYRRMGDMDTANAIIIESMKRAQ